MTKRILLVEDDLPKMTQITDVVAGRDVELTVAKSINEAIRRLDESSFDCVLLDMSLPTFNEGPNVAASQQVAEAVNSLCNQLKNTNSEISNRESEISQHMAAPLPESDLKSFFLEYVDVCAKRGRQALKNHLESIVYPERAGFPQAIIRPLSFNEVSGVLDQVVGGEIGYMVEHLPRAIPDMRAGYPTNSGEALTFLFKDQIKEGMARLMDENPIHYRRPEACGMPLVERRERIALLNEELSSLRSEKAEIEAKITKLKGI